MARLHRSSSARSSSPDEAESAEQRLWLRWFSIPAVVAALCLGATFGTGQLWYLAVVFAAFLVDIGFLIWLGLTTEERMGGDVGRPVPH